MKSFDIGFYIRRNKERAIIVFGNRLDENRKIVGTKFYFDESWRLCEVKESETGESN